MLGQILLAQRMGKKRIIAETGAGMHGVATATLCARFGLECIVYMGSVDVERQKANVFRMQMLGAKVVPVESGSKTLKDAMNEALRDWVTNVGSTFYCIGTIAGPHPYPMMVRDFQSIIGRETREQMQEAEGRLPDLLVACIGGGSNAMGLFHPFLDERGIGIYGVEAAGHGIETGMHAASIAGRRLGVLHGNRTYLLMNEDGQINEAHSISAGLDYPASVPSMPGSTISAASRFFGDRRRGAGRSFQLLSKLEGIIPALRARARHRQGARARAEEAEGSPDGRQSLRPRRQGPRHGRRASAGQGAMMTRIDGALPRSRRKACAALMTFVMAGDPDYETSLAIVKALPPAGADLIEIGMPFTDPMADGPAIQAAGLRALSAGRT